MTSGQVTSTVAVIFLIVGLVLVRVFEHSLFYDPLNAFFNGAFHGMPLPEINSWKIGFAVSTRYVLNVLLSLGIIYFLYKDRNYIKASLWVYLFTLIILLPILIILIQMEGEFVKRAIFYIRRFLIHPIILFVLVAGFYFLRKQRQSMP